MAVKKTNDRFKARRKRLWRKNPRCRNCGVVTILPEDMMKRYGITDGSKMMSLISREDSDRMATIQHLVSRLDPNRTKHKPNEIRYDLWCNRCNSADGRNQLFLHQVNELRARFMKGVRAVVIRGGA